MASKSVPRPRRAAGTKTMSDLLLHPAQGLNMVRGLPATDPAKDIADLESGQPLAIVARRRDDHRRWRAGTLILDTKAPHVLFWRPRFRPRAASPHYLNPPIEITVMHERAGLDRGTFQQITLHIDSRSWTFRLFAGPSVTPTLAPQPRPRGAGQDRWQGLPDAADWLSGQRLR